MAGGGTGVTTLTGIVKANGTGVFTAVSAPSGALLGDSDVQNISGGKTFFDQMFKLRNPANTQTLTFINPVITSSYNAKFIDAFDYMVMKDGSNYVAKRDNWALESSNSDAKTVIQYAIDNAGIGGAVALKGVGASNYFSLTSQLSLVDKNVFLTGFNSNPGAGNAAVLQKNYATAEPLVNITNTVFANNGLRNLGVLGNSTAGSTGIKMYIGRGNILENVNVSLFGTGVEASNWVDCDVRSLRSTNNLTYGLKMVATSALSNTVRSFGGSISSNPTDLYIDASSCNDIGFFGTEFEGANSGYVHGVHIEAGSNDVLFAGCSFEKNAETNPVFVYDNGNNNTYFKCRFHSSVSSTAAQFRSSSRNNTLLNCFFQGTHTVLIDSGASNINIINNMKATNTPLTCTLTDNGTNTRVFGNSQMGTGWEDKLPYQITFNDLIEQKVITVPSNPAAGFVRVYPKATDANNDSLYIKAKQQGAVAELNFFP